jgi:hypothetical protein
VIFARYAPLSRRLWATAAAAGFLAVFAPGASADVAMSGSFLATKDCPVFQSFGKGTNPGGVKIVQGHSYPLLAKNAPEASHYRIRVEGAEPPERWVSAECGNFSDKGADILRGCSMAASADVLPLASRRANQQPSPSASSAIPATRPTAIPAPVTSAPKSHLIMAWGYHPPRPSPPQSKLSSSRACRPAPDRRIVYAAQYQQRFGAGGAPF